MRPPPVRPRPLSPAMAQHPLLDGADGLPLIQDRPVQDYFIVKQEVTLDVNFRHRRIDGCTDIYVITFNDRVDEIALDAAHCRIDMDRVTITDLREAHGDVFEGPRRGAVARYDDPYLKLSHPAGWSWTAEHHDLRRIRARSVFHARKADVAAENRELDGCNPAYGSLRVGLRPGAPTRTARASSSASRSPASTPLTAATASTRSPSPSSTRARAMACTLSASTPSTPASPTSTRATRSTPAPPRASSPVSTTTAPAATGASPSGSRGPSATPSSRPWPRSPTPTTGPPASASPKRTSCAR